MIILSSYICARLAYLYTFWHKVACSYMKQYSFTIKSVICKYQHKYNDLQPILQTLEFRLYWMKKREVSGGENVTTRVAFQAVPAFVCFCSYQAQAFPITSGTTARQRVCSFIFFPVGFKTSRTLQALTLEIQRQLNNLHYTATHLNYKRETMFWVGFNIRIVSEYRLKIQPLHQSVV